MYGWTTFQPSNVRCAYIETVLGWVIVSEDVPKSLSPWWEQGKLRLSQYCSLVFLSFLGFDTMLTTLPKMLLIAIPRVQLQGRDAALMKLEPWHFLSSLFFLRGFRWTTANGASFWAPVVLSQWSGLFLWAPVYVMSRSGINSRIFGWEGIVSILENLGEERFLFMT